MSLEEQITSKSCKERANAISLLEKEWLKDKTSNGKLLQTLLKEKNTVVLEQLIPTLKVIPFSIEIADFVIENLKTPKLKPKIFDYLDCKHKQLDIQLLFDQLLKKNPRFVENVLLYIIHYYNNEKIGNEFQITQLRQTLGNSDSNVRKRAVHLMKMFYTRDNTIDLSDLKPILVKEIKEGIAITENNKDLNKDNYIIDNETAILDKDESNAPILETNKQIGIICETTQEELSTDQKDFLSNCLSDSNWKTRLEAVEKIAKMKQNAHLFTGDLNKRLKDPNIQIFCASLAIIKECNLNFDREILVQKLADKKLQQKIIKFNLIRVSQNDFLSNKNNEIDKMLIEIAIIQGNKMLKESVLPLESSARKDLRETVKKYLAFCDGRSLHKEEKTTNKNKIKIESDTANKQFFQSKVNSEENPAKVVEPHFYTHKDIKENKITKDDVDNFSISEPISPIEQRELIRRFNDKYDLFAEKDFKKKLEGIEKVFCQLIKEQDFLRFIYCIKERNKMMNLKFLEIIARSQNIDPFLLCHIIVKIFTDPQIFNSFLEICRSLDERKILLFFIKFIQKNKKGKLFEKGTEVIAKLHDKIVLDDTTIDPNDFIGKEKQIIIKLSKDLKESKQKENIAEVYPHLENKSSEHVPISEDVLVQKFESSVILDEPGNQFLDNKSKTIDEIQQPFVYNSIKNSNRLKDGKNIENCFSENIETLFSNYKVEASDFIVKYLFEEKSCLCGAKKGLECCLRVLIEIYAAERYVLSTYEAEKYVKLITDENLFQMLEKVYPRSKILVLRSRENSFKAHIGKSFRFREYNMSPLRKKTKPLMNPEKSIFPLVGTIPNNKNEVKFIVEESFNDSFDCMNEDPDIQIKQSYDDLDPVITRNMSKSPSINDKFSKICEKRSSINNTNNFIISDLYKNKDSSLKTILNRVKEDISSLLYISNSVVNAIVQNYNDPTAIDILMILSTNKAFLSEIEYETMKMLHLQIIKNIEEKEAGGDILINLCLNAPVPVLLKVYLNIYADNNQIVLKLIWRNSKRKYLKHTQKILEVFDEFFELDLVFDDLTFKIIQLHISELVLALGDKILEFPMNDQLHKIITNMLKRLGKV